MIRHTNTTSNIKMIHMVEGETWMFQDDSQTSQKVRISKLFFGTESTL
jgi:hypothetical protein